MSLTHYNAFIIKVQTSKVRASGRQTAQRSQCNSERYENLLPYKYRERGDWPVHFEQLNAKDENPIVKSPLLCYPLIIHKWPLLMTHIYAWLSPHLYGLIMKSVTMW